MNRSELIRKAEKIYEERFKAELERTHLNRFAAIEPESGEYFLGNTLSEASLAARTAYPERRTFVIRIGHRATVEIGILNK